MFLRQRSLPLTVSRSGFLSISAQVNYESIVRFNLKTLRLTDSHTFDTRYGPNLTRKH